MTPATVVRQDRDSDLETPRRNGLNQVELMAAWNVLRECAAMPASIVVQMALWPEKIADWAAAEKIDSSVVYNMLAGTKPYRPTRKRLAHRLGVDVAVIDALIDSQRVEAPVRTPVPAFGFAEFVRRIRDGDLFGPEQRVMPVEVQARGRTDRTQRGAARTGQIPLRI